MAITQTTYTGDGSTTNYSFTFEYLKQADVKVTLDTVATTAFTQPPDIFDPFLHKVTLLLSKVLA